MARPLAGLIPALAWLAATAVGPVVRAGEPAPLPDRYGPSPVAGAPAAALHAPSYAASSRETARAAPMRILSWPGKSVTAPPQAAPATYASQSYAPPAYTPPAYAAPAPVPVVSPTFAPAPTAPTRAAPPPPYFGAPTPGTPPPAATSLAGPLASAAPAPTPAPGGQHARLYSVHRAYGMQPDPAPIPPQFFAQTADLTAPATPDPIPNRAANAASRNAVNAARLASTDTN